MKINDIVADYIIKQMDSNGRYKVRRIHEESFVELIKLPSSISEETIERIASIKHANVQEILAAFEIDRNCYLTTPWIEDAQEGLNDVSLDGSGELWLEGLLAGMIYLTNNKFSLPPAEEKSIIRSNDGKCFISVMALLSHNDHVTEVDWLMYLSEKCKSLVKLSEAGAYRSALETILNQDYESLKDFSKALQGLVPDVIKRQETEVALLKKQIESSGLVGDSKTDFAQNCEIREPELKCEINSLGDSNNSIDIQNTELTKKLELSNEELRAENLYLQNEVMLLKKNIRREKRVYSPLKLCSVFLLASIGCWWVFMQKSVSEQTCLENNDKLQKNLIHARADLLKDQNKIGVFQCENDDIKLQLEKLQEKCANYEEILRNIKDLSKAENEDFDDLLRKLEEQIDELDKLQKKCTNYEEILRNIKDLSKAKADDFSDLIPKVEKLINDVVPQPSLIPSLQESPVKSIDKNVELNKKRRELKDIKEKLYKVDALEKKYEGVLDGSQAEAYNKARKKLQNELGVKGNAADFNGQISEWRKEHEKLERELKARVK